MSSRSPLTVRVVVIDVVVVALVSAVALSPLRDVYAGSRWMVAAGGGVALGLAVALLTAALRWGALLTALLTVVGYVLAGPALAVPGQAVEGFVPSPPAVRELLDGTVDSWRNSLTLVLPLGSEHHVLVVPLVVAGLGALASGLFLWRSPWPSVGPLPLVGMFLAAATFGARASDVPVLRGVLLAVVLLVWIRWRAMRHVRTSWVRRVGLTVAVVGAAAVAGWGLTAATAGNPTRDVLRDHVDPPLQQLDFKSPLSKYRSYYKDHEEDTLFTIEGMPAGARVRLATMDDFDGVVWNVSTTSGSNGSSTFDRAPASARSDAITVTIDDDYTGPWVPTIGATTGVTLSDDANPSRARQLLLNGGTGAVAQLGDVEPGDVYTIDWSTASDHELDTSDHADKAVMFPRPARRLPQLDALAQTWLAESGASSDVEVAQTIAQGFSVNGFFSNGLADDQFPTPSGHGAKRIADLIADPGRMIGNDEQYASAMALEMQSLGMPARVVLGFEPGTGPRFTGDDIAAWVEVKFVRSGWVAFDPTPPEDQRPTVVLDDPNPVPQPNVVQPPVLPREPADLTGTPPEGAGQDLPDRIWDVIWMILGYLWVGLKILLLLSPLWGIVLLKRVRRRRRRTDPDLVVRLSGGWREVTDRARDLGTTVPRSRTRYESGVVLNDRFPGVDLAPLATVADRHVFGPVPPSREEVTAYWADVNTALRRMRRAVPWWRRPLAWFSPASIPWQSVGTGVAGRARVARDRFGTTRAGASLRRAASSIASHLPHRTRRRGRR